MELCADIPRYLCLSYICIRLAKTLYRKVRYRSVASLELADSNQEEKSLLNVVQDNSVEMRYVRNLFRSKRNNVSRRWFYEWRDDFHFSSRVVSVYSSIFLLLYLFLIQICVQLLPYLDSLQELIQTFIDVSPTQHSVPLLVRPFLWSVVIGTMITVGQLLLLLAGIRRNLFQVFRGDDSEIPRRDRSQYEKYAIGNFHFAGYLIGYLLWGLLLGRFRVVCFLLGDLRSDSLPSTTGHRSDSEIPHSDSSLHLFQAVSEQVSRSICLPARCRRCSSSE